MAYEPRLYRGTMEKGRFRSFTVMHRETDLWIGVDTESWRRKMEDTAGHCIALMRRELDTYISQHPEFNGLKPVSPAVGALGVVKEMCCAGVEAGVGPMAAVAGMFAARVGCALSDKYSPGEIVVENGGDVYLSLEKELLMAVQAGRSPLSGKIGFTIPADMTPLGVCTSAGTVGHSCSFGNADAVVIACRSAVLADAFATAFANRVRNEKDVSAVIDEIRQIEEIITAVVVCGETVAYTGAFPLRVLRDRAVRA